MIFVKAVRRRTGSAYMALPGSPGQYLIVAHPSQTFRSCCLVVRFHLCLARTDGFQVYQRRPRFERWQDVQHWLRSVKQAANRRRQGH